MNCRLRIASEKVVTLLIGIRYTSKDIGAWYLILLFQRFKGQRTKSRAMKKPRGCVAMVAVADQEGRSRHERIDAAKGIGQEQKGCNRRAQYAVTSRY